MGVCFMPVKDQYNVTAVDHVEPSWGLGHILTLVKPPFASSQTSFAFCLSNIFKKIFFHVPKAHPFFGASMSQMLAETEVGPLYPDLGSDWLSEERTNQRVGP